MKIVVYTCITNDFDSIKEFPKQEGVDYICFTDKPVESKTWEIRQVEPEEDSRRTARKYKLLTHRFLPNYDYSIWLDGTITPPKDVIKLIDCLKEADIGTFKHRDRDCLYKEAHICIEFRLDTESLILEQIDRYSREGYPENNGLVETRVLVRKHTPQVEKFNELWWKEVKEGSRRDQISFNYCIWKLGMKYVKIPRVGFIYTKHNLNLNHIEKIIEKIKKIGVRIMKFPESKLAHKYLDRLKGIEIGGAAHNPFGLDTINVDYTDSMDTLFKRNEYALCQERMKVDIVADGADLPFPDKSYDFIISSHVIEHFYDPIKALLEWKRVAKKYIFIICPHSYRLPEEHRPLTTLEELKKRHRGEIPEEQTLSPKGHRMHRSVWDTKSFLELCKYLKLNVIEYQDVDDKVGNGFTIIIKLD